MERISAIERRVIKRINKQITMGKAAEILGIRLIEVRKLCNLYHKEIEDGIKRSQRCSECETQDDCTSVPKWLNCPKERKELKMADIVRIDLDKVRAGMEWKKQHWTGGVLSYIYNLKFSHFMNWRYEIFDYEAHAHRTSERRYEVDIDSKRHEFADLDEAKKACGDHLCEMIRKLGENKKGDSVMSYDINPTGALYAFAGYLTTRSEIIKVGGSENCTPIAQLLKFFVKEQGLPEVLPGWEEQFKPMVEGAANGHARQLIDDPPDENKLGEGS